MPLPTWIEKVLIPWQERMFCGCSPLVTGRDAQGRIQLMHQWAELDGVEDRVSARGGVAEVAN
jgi:hypothetical protein